MFPFVLFLIWQSTTGWSLGAVLCPAPTRDNALTACDILATLIIILVTAQELLLLFDWWRILHTLSLTDHLELVQFFLDVFWFLENAAFYSCSGSRAIIHCRVQIADLVISIDSFALPWQLKTQYDMVSLPDDPAFPCVFDWRHVSNDQFCVEWCVWPQLRNFLLYPLNNLGHINWFQRPDTLLSTPSDFWRTNSRGNDSI